MFDSRPGWWIAKRLAARLGFERIHPWPRVEEYLRGRAEASGLNWDELRRRGVVVGRPEPVTIEDGVEPAFGTPSGKIELWSQQLADAGLAPVPEFVPPDEPPPGHFRLLTGRVPVHTFGRTTNNRILGEITAENMVWINRRSAAELGLKQGDRVVLVNQDGRKAGPVAVKATERIRPGVAFLVHGFGHEDPRLHFAHGRGASDSELCSKVKIDPVIGSTGMNVNFVRLERTGEA